MKMKKKKDQKLNVFDDVNYMAKYLNNMHWSSVEC